MKKLFIILLVIIASLSTMFAFTACDLLQTVDGDETDTIQSGSENDGVTVTRPDDGGNVSEGEHIHSYVWKITKPTQTTQGTVKGTCACGETETIVLPVLTDSKYIKTQDTATCSEKGEIKYTIQLDGSTYVFTVETPATGEHNYTNGKCTVCGAVDPDYVPHTHNYVDKSNESGHWTECDCGDKTALVPHSYTYAHDSDYHWQVCSVKGETTAKVAHNYVNGVCVCGAVDSDYVPHTHNYVDKSNASGHWTECDCGDKTALVPHSYTYAHDSDYHWQVCSVKGETTAKVVHNYVNGVCVCGAVKPAEELDYKLNDNGTEYSVIGIGTVTSKQVVIPATYHNLPVTEIAEKAFYNGDMTSISIPASVTHIGSYSFYECTALTKVDYTGTIAQWCSIVFDWFRSNPLHYAHSLYINGTHVTDPVIQGIEEVSQLAFERADIKTVSIENGVKSVGGYCFWGCESLTSAVIANSVTSVGNYLFAECSNLASVKISENLKAITDSMFSLCGALKQITVYEGIEYIGQWAFESTGITTFTVPSTVTSIGQSAFLGCLDLEEIIFADTSSDWLSWSQYGVGVKEGQVMPQNPSYFCIVRVLYGDSSVFGANTIADSRLMAKILARPIQALMEHLIDAEIYTNDNDAKILLPGNEGDGIIAASIVIDGEEYSALLEIDLQKLRN